MTKYKFPKLEIKNYKHFQELIADIYYSDCKKCHEHRHHLKTGFKGMIKCLKCGELKVK
jgi:hypothetical protein